MADENRAPSDSLSQEKRQDENPNERLDEHLKETPHRFGFYTALRRLECRAADKPRLGESVRPGDDCLRLGQLPSMAFSPATITEYTPPEASGDAARMKVGFQGLFGPNGPLPLHLTGHAIRRQIHHHDHTLRHFADIFHHRFLTLFYRAWATGQPTTGFDRFGEGRSGEDRFGKYLRAIAGFGERPWQNPGAALPDLVHCHYAGRLSHQPKNPEGLVAMVRQYFRMPVEMEEFAGKWLTLPSQDHCRLGQNPDAARLGVSTTIGRRVPERSHKFILRAGPLDLDRYQALLPGGEALQKLRAMVHDYVGGQYDWDLELMLKKEEVPAMVLGRSGALGWTTWLGEKGREEDARGACLAGSSSDGG
uniref:Type VI secretion system protein ImpH n=1 Tax=Candidatus Kentrum sp. DK TaxID=2126562 RepID=A0A450SP32_9GAMM|nr:MAG: type VI secretion system protein ImpH [Candidatus Kentron sp. DK]VFJ62745.1 MAG: type VI secretion system protein ImpH [Candidatus Kentron sp. DK]